MSNEGRHREGFAGFKRGDTVTVRSLDEILATLDADGKLDGLPFMPEMAACCGRSFRVCRRAEKTCVEGIGMRGMKNTVFLEGLRCDGAAHDGCQRGCLFFWKKNWLMANDRDKSVDAEPTNDRPSEHASFIRDVSQLPTTQSDRFYCQSTELARATADLAPGKLRYYLHDLWIGEITLWRFAYVLWLAATNRAWRLLRGRGFYQLTGEQNKTLSAELNLRAGELVEIRNAAEIEATLDAQGRNRGLSFEPEMAQHCGRRYRVSMPLQKIIDEQTGKMVQLNNTVILDGLVCQGICMLNCPRANYFYWREIWLKRV